MGLPRSELPPPGQRALHDQPLSRRLRCLRGTRVRHGDEAVRLRRLLAAGSQVPGELARRGHALGRDGLRGRLSHELGISADRKALEARHASRCGQNRVRGQTGGRRLQRQQRDPERRAVRRRHARSGVLPARVVPFPGRPPRQDSTCPRIHSCGRSSGTGSSSPCAATGPSAAGPTARDRSSPPPSTTSSAVSAASTCSSSPASACPWPAWIARATGC